MNSRDKSPRTAPVHASAKIRGGTGKQVVSLTGRVARSVVSASSAVEKLPNNGAYDNRDTLRELLSLWSSNPDQAASRHVYFFGKGGEPVGQVWFKGARIVAADFFGHGPALTGMAALAALSENYPSGRYEGVMPVDPPAGRDDFVIGATGGGGGKARQMAGSEVVAILQKERDDADKLREVEKLRLSKETPPPSLDRSGSYANAEYFLDRMVNFWVAETGNPSNEAAIGIRRADMYECGERIGSIWFSGGIIIAAQYSANDARVGGIEGLWDLVLSLTRGNYVAIRHAEPPAPELREGIGPEKQAMRIMVPLLNELQQAGTGRASNSPSGLVAEARGALFAPGSVGWDIEISPSPRKYRVVGAPVKLGDAPRSKDFFRVLCVQAGFPVVQESAGGPALFVDPQQGWAIVRSCSLEDLFRGRELSDFSRESLRRVLRSALRQELGDVPEVPSPSEFSPYGAVPFRVVKDGVERYGVGSLSGDVLTLLEPGAVLRAEGGFLWAELPDGTVRYVTESGKLSGQAFSRVERAGALPLWMLVNLEEVSASRLVVDSILPPPEREAVKEVRVINARLQSHDAAVSGGHAAALLEEGFWDERRTPADPALAELRSSFLARLA